MDIDTLVERSTEPVDDAWLEDLQTRIHGATHRHPRFLYHLARELEPALALELGVQWGVTSGYLCAAARGFGGRVVGVDVEGHPRPATELWQRYRNYTFLHMDSLQAVGRVKELVKDYGPLGLVYQDSSHEPDEFKREWTEYAPLLGDGAVWVANLYPGDTLKDYWDWLPVVDKRVYQDSLYPGAAVGVAVLAW